MKYVYMVGVSDCESNYTVCVCTTKKIAERKLFKERDKLVREWKELLLYEQKICSSFDSMYKPMIKNLTRNNDYENWDNYPHECPYIAKIKVIEK